MEGGGGGKELNRGSESVVDSKFLCSKYDGRADQEANETLLMGMGS